MLFTKTQRTALILAVSFLVTPGVSLFFLRHVVAQIPCVPIIDHVAFNQVIQTSPPTISPIDLKQTTMRVFLKRGSGCSDGVINVGGILFPTEAALQNVDARFSLWNLGTPNVKADNGPIHVVHSPPYSKNTRQHPEDLNHPSLNFTFTPFQAYDMGASAQGYTEIGVCLVLSGTSSCLSQSTIVVEQNFGSVRNPRVLGVTIELDGDVDEPRPDIEDVNGLHYFAQGVWPFTAQPWYRAIQPADTTDISTLDFDPTILENTEKLWDLLETYRLANSSSSEPIDCIYGWIGGTAADGGSSPPSGDVRCVAFGDIVAPLTGEASGAGVFAHEIGHFVVQFDPPIHESGTIGDVGWWPIKSIGDFGRIRETIMNPIMQVNGGFNEAGEWASIDSYTAALDAENFTPAGVPITSEFLVVSGVVSQNLQSAILRPIVEITGTAPLTPTLSEEIVISAFSASETEVYSTTVRRSSVAQTWFTVPVPNNLEIESVRVSSVTDTLATITRTESAPTATILYPADHETITDTLTIEWEGGDLDGDNLFATVQYSHDGGGSWTPLAIRTDSAVLSIDATHLPSTSDGVIRLFVTDGLNTTVETVSGIEVGENHAPLVIISSPRHGGTYRVGANVPLVAIAFDLEDGDVFEVTDTVASPIQWSSSLDGSIGSGSIVNADSLSTGTHTITLSVEDFLQAEVTSTIAITIKP